MVSTKNRLSDDVMGIVTGGYVETFGFAEGSDIECPKCHNKEKSLFKVTVNMNNTCNDYECLFCHNKFSVY